MFLEIKPDTYIVREIKFVLISTYFYSRDDLISSQGHKHSLRKISLFSNTNYSRVNLIQQNYFYGNPINLERLI